MYLRKLRYGLMRQRLEVTYLNMFKELKETMSKELEESMGTRSHYEG